MKNLDWARPNDWSIMKDGEKGLWNDIANNIEHFYRDMRVCRHINVGLSDYATPNECLAYMHFMKILEDQNKIYDATNMLYKIAVSEGGTMNIVEMTEEKMTGKDLHYVYLSQFAFTLIQTYVSNINILKKTLTTMSLTTKKGKPWNRPIESTSPESLLDALEKDSKKPASFLKKIIFKNKPLRNAFSHGLFWYEDEKIFWIDNPNSPRLNSMSFKSFINTVREQSLFTQCFLWATSKLIAEGLFRP